MTKVLHIITRLDMGGSAQNTLQTCLHLDHDRYRVALAHGLSHESGMTADEEQTVADGIRAATDRGVEIFEIPSLVRRVHPWLDLKTFFALLALLWKEKPTIVHTHTSKAGILGRLAAWLTRVPIIVQTPHGHVFYGHFGPTMARFFLGLEKLAAKFTDTIVALTRGEYDDYLRYKVADPEKLVTIHSGVDIERFSNVRVDPVLKRRELGLESDSALVGTIGWLLPIKGPQYLLRAMAAIWQQENSSGLVFVGKGDMEAELKAEAHSLGVADRVHFLGWREDIPEIMPLFDIFVLPSMNEGMGRVLVEAMAAGKPVVASRAGGIPDLVQQGGNGLLVAAGSEAELADAIGQLLSDPERAQSLGRQGKSDCQRFGMEAMVAKIDRLYTDLLGNRKRSDFH